MESRQLLPTKTALALTALAALTTLAGCGDRMLDAGPVNYVLGGGPPADASTPVRRMSEQARPYPNLGSVPERPTDAPTPEQADADIARLAKARTDNRAAAKALKAVPGGPAPLAVPPAPNLRPGSR